MFSLFKKFIKLNMNLSEKYYLQALKNLPDNFHPYKADEDYCILLEQVLKDISESKSESEKIYILEIGAGKYSSFTEELKEKYSLELTGLDISFKELQENTINTHSIVYDAANPNYEKDLVLLKGKYDLVISRMVLEHIKTPEITHKLIAYCLKPEGKAFHYHPTLFEFTFLLNKLIPTKLSAMVLKFLYPYRVITGVFPAYYSKCTAFNDHLENFYKSCGFKLVFERHYYGTEYFRFFFPLYFIAFNTALLCSYLDIKLFSAYSSFCLQKMSNSNILLKSENEIAESDI